MKNFADEHSSFRSLNTFSKFAKTPMLRQAMYSCLTWLASFCTGPPVVARRRTELQLTPELAGGRRGFVRYPFLLTSKLRTAPAGALHALGHTKGGRGFPTFSKGFTSAMRRDTHGGGLNWDVVYIVPRKKRRGSGLPRVAAGAINGRSAGGRRRSGELLRMT